MVNRILKGADLRVLLVEDNPAHAELIIRSLEDHDTPLDIYHAPDGEVALNFLYQRDQYTDLAENPRPHIILLDIRMPKVSGLEVLEELKSDPNLKSIPVIILTTSEAEQDVARAYDHYANSYLVKPVDFDKFVQLMNELGLYWFNWNHLDRP